MVNRQKYLDELEHEKPDAVLGNLMSDFGYRLKLRNIKDACYFYQSANRSDRNIINRNQPMFYNVKHHRSVNKADVIKIIKNLSFHHFE